MHGRTIPVPDDGLAAASLTPPVEPAAPGRIGRYRICGLLGKGGMAEVYLAEDERLGRVVALKRLRPDLAESADAELRLNVEGQAALLLRHPAAPLVLDWNLLGEGPAAGVAAPEGSAQTEAEARAPEAPYLVMEYIRGPSLEQFVQAAGLPPPEAVAMIGCRLGSVLGAAHAEGIVHRDLKPSNVLVDLDRPGRLVLTDFGVAQFDLVAQAMEGGRLTTAGRVVGTPAFMSPEQMEGAVVDARADVYALGVLMYQLATGRLPFGAGDAAQLKAQAARKEYVRPSEHNPRVPRYLEEAIARCLGATPVERPSPAEVAEGLRAGLECEGLGHLEAELGALVADPWRYGRELLGRKRRRRVARWVVRGGMVLVACLLVLVGWQWRAAAQAGAGSATGEAQAGGDGEEQGEIAGGEEGEERIRRALEGMVKQAEMHRFALAELEAGHRGAFDEMMQLLDREERYPIQAEAIQRALFDARGKITDWMLEHLARRPRSPSAQTCAWVLGRIAWADDARRDPRIEPALSAALATILATATRDIGRIMLGLQLVAQIEMPADLEPLLWRLLERCRNEDAHACNQTAALGAIGILRDTRGDAIMPALEAMARHLPTRHGLRQVIELVLAGHPMDVGSCR